jgi:hypothetical protein
MGKYCKIEGVSQVKAALARRLTAYGSDTRPSVSVGYTQSYAIYVHENLEAEHPTGQAKFLEQPAREKRKDIKDIVKDEVIDGAKLEDALLKGGLFLQRESQRLCPVATGALRASAFTRPDGEQSVAGPPDTATAVPADGGTEAASGALDSE